MSGQSANMLCPFLPVNQRAFFFPFPSVFLIWFFFFVLVISIPSDLHPFYSLGLLYFDSCCLYHIFFICNLLTNLSFFLSIFLSLVQTFIFIFMFFMTLLLPRGQSTVLHTEHWRSGGRGREVDKRALECSSI